MWFNQQNTYIFLRSYHSFSGGSNVVNPALVVVDLGEDGLMLLDEVLNADQVAAAVGGSGDGLLLANPRLLVLNVAEELLDNERLAEAVTAVLHRRDEGVVAVGQRSCFSWSAKEEKSECDE